METKVCTKCGVDLQIVNFSKDKSLPTGRRADCKDCNRVIRKAYGRTKDGFIARLYGSQRGNSKRRGHTPPVYSKADLKDWLFAQEKFHHLFHLWEVSNYDKMLVPSVDRIDDYEGYNFSNIQLMTWKENYEKLAEDTNNRVHNKSRKAVEQYTLEGVYVKTFSSMGDASDSFGVDISNITNACSGKYRSSCGFKWKYKELKNG